MTKEEILEGNKLIEIFIGNEVYNETVIHKSRQRTHISESCFHYDWNALMDVVEKIEKSLGEYVTVIIQDEKCRITTVTDTVDIVKDTATSKIEAVYIAVISFIKWHNSQSK